MKKHVTEVYRLYWSKDRADYVHPATGLTRAALMRAAKDRFNKCEIEYVDSKRNICWLKVFVRVGG